MWYSLDASRTQAFRPAKCSPQWVSWFPWHNDLWPQTGKVHTSMSIMVPVTQWLTAFRLAKYLLQWVSWFPWHKDLWPSDRQSAYLNEYHGSREVVVIVQQWFRHRLTYSLQTGKVHHIGKLMLKCKNRIFYIYILKL